MKKYIISLLFLFALFACETNESEMEECEEKSWGTLIVKNNTGQKITILINYSDYLLDINYDFDRFLNVGDLFMMDEIHTGNVSVSFALSNNESRDEEFARTRESYYLDVCETITHIWEEDDLAMIQ